MADKAVAFLLFLLTWRQLTASSIIYFTIHSFR